MKCPKCGIIMQDNYCMKCGYMKKDNQEYQIKQPVVEKPSNDYDKFIERKFNVGAFFFTNYYYLYKGYYLFGSILSILSFINMFLIIKFVNLVYSNISLSFFEYYIVIFRGLSGPLFLMMLLLLFRSIIYGFFTNFIFVYFFKKQFRENSLIPPFICIGIEILALVLIFYLYVNFNMFRGFI